MLLNDSSVLLGMEGAGSSDDGATRVPCLALAQDIARSHHCSVAALAAVGGEGLGPGELLLASAGVPEAATAGEEDLSLQVSVPLHVPAASSIPPGDTHGHRH